MISGLNNQQYRAYSKLFFHKKESLSVDALNFFQKLRLGFNNILTHEEEQYSSGLAYGITSTLPKRNARQEEY